ncbi:hypothetical protein MHBO_000697 [Bonamia ostreae]|uniref:Uncharacterized protein n=1 Tax=Bonamia ostreae TaxID=126728 RepID=A0ABV2AGK6_9EUKA
MGENKTSEQYFTFTVTNDTDRKMSFFDKSKSNFADYQYQDISPGETIEGYTKSPANLWAVDALTGERQQEFEVFSDGEHLSIIPQPKIVARQKLLSNYSNYFRQKYFEENGIEWKGDVLRAPVKSFMWNANYKNFEQIAKSSARKFSLDCNNDNNGIENFSDNENGYQIFSYNSNGKNVEENDDDYKKIDNENKKNNDKNVNDVTKDSDNGDLKYKLLTERTFPKVFSINGFLSKDESKFIASQYSHLLQEFDVFKDKGFCNNLKFLLFVAVPIFF